MVVRWITPVLGILLLLACGALPEAASPTPVVVTQVVPQTVVVTRIVPQLATVVVTATPLPKPPTATPLPTAGKWDVSVDTSSFDDSQTVVLTLAAENEISGLIGTVRPYLLLRCEEQTIDSYIYVGMQPDVESGNLDGATARYRFDSEAAVTTNMGLSTSRNALFFMDAEAIITDMEQHEGMVFQFTPFSSSPVEMTFDLQGLTQAIEPLRTACSV